MFKKISQQYNFLCMQYIRPNRALYNLTDLG